MKFLLGHNLLPRLAIPFCMVFAIGTSLAFCGCTKSKPVAVQQNTTDQNTTPTATENHTAVEPQSAVAQPTVVLPNGEPDLRALNRGLLRWLASNRRVPANFDDFAATAGITIPPPPAGKKYIIAKNMHIQLVDN